MAISFFFYIRRHIGYSSVMSLKYYWRLTGFYSNLLCVVECRFFLRLADYFSEFIALFMPAAVGAGVSENVAVTTPSLQM